MKRLLDFLIFELATDDRQIRHGELRRGVSSFQLIGLVDISSLSIG